jgi:DNA repair exonuclease SbcCD ATPase subunit
MLILKSLTFCNIGRFVEEQTIDFTKLGSLVKVDGKNNNTDGSSGAGKSTIFKALDFLLGLSDISNIVLQSRLTKESMYVIGIFDFNGIPLKMERSKKLLIDLNGEITTGSSKITEEKLDQILGMERDLFRKILHKRQNEGGFFLDMIPSEIHKFLTNCLGLQKEQEKIPILDERLVLLEKNYSLIFNTLESNKKAIEATKEAISILGPMPILNIEPGAIVSLETRYKEVESLYKFTKYKHKVEIESLEESRPKIISISYDRTEIERLENEIGTVLAKISELEKLELERQSNVKFKELEILKKISTLEENERNRQASYKQEISEQRILLIKNQTAIETGNRAKEEASSLIQDLEKFKNSICPTCEQSWIDDTCKAKEQDTRYTLRSLRNLVTDGEKAIKEREAIQTTLINLRELSLPQPISELDFLNQEISQLKVDSEAQIAPETIELKLIIDFKNKELLSHRQLEKDHQFKENANSQLLLANFAQKQIELREKQENDLKIAQEEENKALSELESAKNKLRSFEEAKNTFQDSFDKLNAQLDKYQLDVNTKETELNEIKEEIELAQESKKAIKSYLSCNFDDALDSIGDVATRLIRAIPNMSTATIQFEGIKETKEGKIKEEVTCSINMDGEVGIPVKSLSGGERSSTDLAIDLSVIKFIEERTGLGIDLFVLDEPFTGLDSKNILEALEILRECSVDKRLLIVDHNPEVYQFIENRLTVVRDGLSSRIIQ